MALETASVWIPVTEAGAYSPPRYHRSKESSSSCLTPGLNSSGIISENSRGSGDSHTTRGGATGSGCCRIFGKLTDGNTVQLEMGSDTPDLDSLKTYMCDKDSRIDVCSVHDMDRVEVRLIPVMNKALVNGGARTNRPEHTFTGNIYVATLSMRKSSPSSSAGNDSPQYHHCHKERRSSRRQLDEDSLLPTHAATTSTHHQAQLGEAPVSRRSSSEGGHIVNVGNVGDLPVDALMKPKGISDDGSVKVDEQLSNRSNSVGILGTNSKRSGLSWSDYFEQEERNHRRETNGVE